ncbi:hypothetical protein EMN47_13060 [Prolixibacteraceae bacterium JC049]|nr:hypothetical protein [Prolixibacteraceae bacterium JC049]
MKSLFTIILLLFISTNSFCQSKVTGNKSICGHWVSQNYINEVVKTNDPYLAHQKSPYRILIINKENQLKDTIKVSTDKACQSEASSFLYYQRQQNTLKYIGANLGPSSNLKYLKEKAHSINLSSDGKKLTITSQNKGKEYYVRIPNLGKKTYNENLDLYITRLLFHDKYRYGKKLVEFIPDGQINGFKNYKSFRVGLFYCFDFSLYENNYIDFYESEKPSRKELASRNLKNQYSFSFDGDTLKLYAIKEDYSEDYKIIKGELKYKLVRCRD